MRAAGLPGRLAAILPPGAVQPGGKIVHLGLGIRRPIQGAADGEAGDVPGFGAQQTLPWVGVDANRDEHIAPLQPGSKAFEAANT